MSFFNSLFQPARATLALVPVLLVALVASPRVYGQGVTASLQVQSGSSTWTSDLSPLFQTDSQTGNYVLKPFGSSLGSPGWGWSTYADEISATTSDTYFAAWNPGGGAAQVTLFEALADPDPSLFYSFAARNNTGNTQTYTFTYGEALVPPTSGTYGLTSDIATVLTKSATLGGVGGFLQTLKLSSDNGATFIDAPGHQVGTSVTNPSSTTTGIFDQSTNPAFGSFTVAAGVFNYWELVTTFTLSANSSTGIVGEAEVTAIPEVSEYALLAGGLVLVLAAARRRLAAGA